MRCIAIVISKEKKPKHPHKIAYLNLCGQPLFESYTSTPMSIVSQTTAHNNPQLLMERLPTLSSQTMTAPNNTGQTGNASTRLITMNWHCIRERDNPV